MHTIERIGNELAVMNRDGEIVEVHLITSRRLAKRQIAQWAKTYTFEYATGLNLI